MASKATGHVVTVTAGRFRMVEVTVIHRDTDSFTRSVDPCAKRYLTSGKAGRFQQAYLIDGRYAHTEQYAARDKRPWWVSTITFRIDN
jgi:hypothetical protein